MLKIIGPSFVAAVLARRRSLKYWLFIIATIQRKSVRSRNRLKDQESLAMHAPKRLQASKSTEINHMNLYLLKSLKKKLLKSIVE
jgi:hypothetical protein